ncbi:MAG: ABC transporter ATP-binding protein [Halobacteriales archaeon]
MILSVEDGTKTYADQRALDGINFACKRGEFVAIYGPSGSGKTTLLNLLGTLDTPDDGTVRFDGTDVAELDDRERDAIRAERIGFVFQSFRLVPYLSAAENVGLALSAAGIDREEGRVGAFLRKVGLDGKENRKPAALSHGERQRVGIARALIKEPDVVLADEPTGNLDIETGERILELMGRFNDSADVTFVIATHDEAVASVADEALTIRGGAFSTDAMVPDRP